MMRTRDRLLSASAVALALAISPGSAHAQAAGPKRPPAMSADVHAHLDKGGKLYDEGAYDAALIEFQRAYELSGNYKILYNIGLIDAYVKDFASALRHYQKYLAGGSGEIPAARYAEVQKEIARLSGLVAKVEVSTNLPDAELQVDDATVVKAQPSSPLLLNPGTHKIALVVRDTEVARKLITVAAGDSTRLELQAPEMLPVVPAPEEAGEGEGQPAATSARAGVVLRPSSQAARRGAPAHRSFPWTAWLVTGGLAAGTTVMGILALTSASALSDERNSPNADPSRLDSLSTRTKVFVIGADVLGGLTLASAGVSIYLTIRARRERAPVSSHLELGPGRIGIRGSF